MSLATIRYEGPLYDGTDRSRGSIRLDVSTLDDVVLEPTWQRLFFPYPETRAVTARCLPMEEAFAEKIRALGTRTRGRDLYDCWYLLNQDVTIDAGLVERKFAAVDATLDVTVTVTDAEFTRDLDVLLDHPPPYEEVVSTVMQRLEEAGLTVTDQR